MKPVGKNNAERALFLDRDGVICPELGRYRLIGDGFELIPGINDLIDVAKRKGYVVVVVTNQPQVGKGMLTEMELTELNARMQGLLYGKLDAIYYCPHTDADGCNCRKPKSGMFILAAEEIGLDLARSIMVGDSQKDILAGHAAGCRTIFIKNSFRAHDLANCSPDHVIENLAEIAPLI